MVRTYQTTTPKNQMTTTSYLSTLANLNLTTVVEAALGNPNGDAEDSLYNIVQEWLGFDPPFSLFEQVAMAFELA